MKVKRLVAVLLAALLLVGMIPMNALAAFEFGASGKDAGDRYRIDVMISNNAPATGIKYDPVTEYSDEQELKDNADKANGAWVITQNEKKTIEAVPSTTSAASRVYVGFKATNEQPDKAKGISSFSVVIKYDKKYLSPIRTNANRTTNNPITKKSDETGAGSVLYGCYVNDLASGTANEGYYPESEEIDDATLRANIVAYRGAGEMSGAAVQYVSQAADAEASGMMIASLGLKTNREYEGMATVSSTDWDFVVPFYVNQDAPGGTTTIEVLPYTGTSPSKVQYTMIDLDGFTKINVGNQGVVFDSVGGVTPETMAKLSVANDVYVKIKSTNPEMEAVSTVVPASETSGSTTFKLKLNEYASKGTGWGIGGFKVENADGTTATITGVTDPQGDDKEFTITATGVKAGAVKITANAGVLGDGAGEFTLEDAITAKDPPAAPNVDVSNSTAAVTINSGLYYTIDGGETWTPAAGAGTNLSIEALQDAMDDATADDTSNGVETYNNLLQVAEDEEGLIASPVVLKRYSAPTVTKGSATAPANGAAVDYEQEKLTVSSADWKATFSGDAVGSDGSLTAGLDKANASYDLVLTRDADTAQKIFGVTSTTNLGGRTDHSPALSNTTTDAVKANGQTTVANLKVGDVYGVNQSNSTAPTYDKTVTNVNDPIDAVEGDYIWVRTPGSNTNKTWATKVTPLAGVGNNYVTISLVEANFGQAKVTLKKTGPKSMTWAAFSASNFVLEPDDATATGFDPDSGTVTFDKALDSGTQYKLKVAAAAITGTVHGDNGATGAVTTLELTSDSVGVSDAKGQIEFVSNVVPSGKEATLTVKSGIPTGQRIANVTVASGSLEEKVTWTDTTITVTAKTVTGGPTVNTATLNITLGYINPDVDKTTVGVLEPTDTDTVTISNMGSLTANDVDVSISPAGVATVSLNKDTGVITVTAADAPKGETATITVTNGSGQYAGKAEIVVNVTNKKVLYAQAATLDKAWDNNNEVPADLVKGIVWNDKEGNEIGTTEAIAPTGSITYGNKAENNTDAGSYTLVANLTHTTYAFDMAPTKGGTAATAEIKKATVKKITVGEASVKEGTIESIAAALAQTPVTVETDEGYNSDNDPAFQKPNDPLTLGDLVSVEDIIAALIEAETNAEVAAAEAKAEAAVLKEAEKLYDGTPEYEDGVPTGDFADWLASYDEVELEDGSTGTWTDRYNEVADAEKAKLKEVTKGTSIKQGADLDISDITLDLNNEFSKPNSQFNGNLNDITDSEGADSGKYDASSLNGFEITKKSSGTPGSSVPNVDLVTDGFATADGPVELDENGKITKLPGVIGQKLGTVFKGWATQKGNANTIVKEGREITGDTTLYGIFEGYMNGDYNNSNQRTARPSDPVTRGELLTMLVRAAGIYDDSVDYSTTFADAKGAWYTTYVGCAEEAGILAGDKEGTARPRDNITREEAAIFIAKTFKVTVAEGGTTEFVVDFADTASWAKDYVAALVNNGTSVGNDKQEYEPKKNITRAEVAAMINKYLGLTSTKKTALSGSATSPFVDVQNSSSWYYAEMLFASLNAPYDYYVTEVVYPTR